MKTTLALCMVLTLSACATFKPSDLLDAFKTRNTALTVAEMVADCVVGTSTEALVADDFNYLVGLEQKTKNMQPDKEALKQIIGGRATVYEAGNKWRAVKTVLVGSGLTCDARLNAKAKEVEAVYDKFVDGMEANERLMVAFEWAEVLGGFVGGPHGKIIELSAKAAQ